MLREGDKVGVVTSKEKTIEVVRGIHLDEQKQKYCVTFVSKLVLIPSNKSYTDPNILDLGEVELEREGFREGQRVAVRVDQEDWWVEWGDHDWSRITGHRRSIRFRTMGEDQYSDYLPQAIRREPVEIPLGPTESSE